MANKEVLQQLRRVVMEAPDELLHMRAVVEESPCGTARCALGWSIIDPWFQANTRINEVMPADYNQRRFNNWGTGGIILREIFDLNDQQFNDLFGCDLAPFGSDPHAVSKHDVLDNIDRVLRGENPTRYGQHL